jgi:hypothetical protein
MKLWPLAEKFQRQCSTPSKFLARQDVDRRNYRVVTASTSYCLMKSSVTGRQLHWNRPCHACKVGRSNIHRLGSRAFNSAVQGRSSQRPGCCNLSRGRFHDAKNSSILPTDHFKGGDLGNATLKHLQNPQNRKYQVLPRVFIGQRPLIGHVQV